MTRPDPNAKTTRDEDDEEARQIEAQFAGLDNDLVEIEATDGTPHARDKALNADVDDGSVGGIRSPPGVRTGQPDTSS